MKRFFFILGILVFALGSYCQVNKFYVDKKGLLTKEPHRPVIYVLMTKNAAGSFVVQQYDLENHILLKGGFKDSLLKVANGRFFYYAKNPDPENSAINLDTASFVICVGYFSNGIRAGTWTEFAKRDVKKCSYEYQDGRLNGTYQRYDKTANDYVLESGEYVDDKRQGDWNLFGYDTLKTIVATQVYKDDKIINEANYITAADFPKDLNKYLMKKLDSFDYLLYKTIKAEITITETGEIKNPELITLQYSKDVIDALKAVLNNLPPFIPEKHNGKAVEMRYIISFTRSGFRSTGNGSFQITLEKPVGNGALFTRSHGLSVTLENIRDNRATLLEFDH